MAVVFQVSLPIDAFDSGATAGTVILPETEGSALLFSAGALTFAWGTAGWAADALSSTCGGCVPPPMHPKKRRTTKAKNVRRMSRFKRLGLKTERGILIQG